MQGNQTNGAAGGDLLVHEDKRLPPFASHVGRLQHFIEVSAHRNDSRLEPLTLEIREDYTDEEWQRLGTTRAAASWEAPLSEVTDLLVQRGYYNVPLDNLLALNDEGKEEDKEEDEPEAFTERWTCWAGTRIDYAWSTNALRQKVSDDGLQLAVVRPSFQHSDHRALLLTLRDANLSSSSMP